MKLGDLEFHILVDGNVYLDGGAMFGVIPKVMWEKKAPADARNRIELAMNCLLIRAGGKNILVETGAGGKMSPKLRDIYGLDGPFLNDRLREYGLDVTEVDIVINTHLHFDHCGGNTRVVGDKVVATYPNARYVVQRGEFEHARRPNERDTASYFPDNYVPIQTAGQIVAARSRSRDCAGRGIDSGAGPHRKYAVRETERRRKDGVLFRGPGAHRRRI